MILQPWHFTGVAKKRGSDTLAKKSNNLQKRMISSACWAAAASLLLFYLGNRIFAYVDPTTLSSDYLTQILIGLDDMAVNPIAIRLTAPGLIIGALLLLIVWFAWGQHIVFMGNYRTGEESGSAKWADEKEMSAFLDSDDPSNNLLFTDKYGLAISRKKFDPEHDRNLNVCVIGGSGSGKTYRYVKPNLMQLNSNYFLTDPKGTLLDECGWLFADNGYKVMSFDMVRKDKSMHYNPLKYVRTDDEILTFVNCLILNTNGDKPNTGDAFWENSEKMLYTALIALMRDWFPENEYNLDTLLKLLSMAKASENDENYMSPLDKVFNQIETGYTEVAVADDDVAVANDMVYSAERSRQVAPSAQQAKPRRAVVKCPSNMLRHAKGDPEGGIFACEHGGFKPSEDFALSNYKNFKVAAGKTLKSILISCNVRLAPIAITEVREILKYDEMELDKLGDPDTKMAIFCIPSDTDRTFSFLPAIMIWQTINILCNKALTDYHGKLPTLVQFMLDEFANIGTLPDIEKTVAVTRSRNISLSIILQSIAQLRGIYDKKADIIVDCCDTTLFLGGKSNSTNKEIAEMIGKETIHQTTFGESHGQSASGSKNLQIQARDLIDAAEIGKMSREDCLLLIAGADPVKDRKIDPQKHDNYIYMVDSHNPACHHTEPFDVLAYNNIKKDG